MAAVWRDGTPTEAYFAVMHVRQTFDVGMPSADVMARLQQAVLELDWKIEASSATWLRCKTGEWWETRSELDLVVGSKESGTRVLVDGEPGFQLPGGMGSGQVQIWHQKMTDEIGKLARAVGASAAPTDLSPPPQANRPLTAPSRRERDALRDVDDEAPVATESTLAMLPGAAWLVDKIGGAIVSILVQKGIAEMMDGPHRGMRGKTEYDLHTGNILVRWPDGASHTHASPKWKGGSGAGAAAIQRSLSSLQATASS